MLLSVIPTESEAILPESSPQLIEASAPPVEHGGQSGPAPTRFGDWEKNGRCTDF